MLLQYPKLFKNDSNSNEIIGLKIKYFVQSYIVN